MNIQDCYYRVSVKALILNDKKQFLLAKEPDDSWDFPGGGLEFGESVEDTIKRELKEELGLSVTTISKKPEFFVTFLKANTNIWMANVFYLTIVDDLDFKPSDECVEIKFFDNKGASGLKSNGGVNASAALYNISFTP